MSKQAKQTCNIVRLCAAVMTDFAVAEFSSDEWEAQAAIKKTTYCQPSYRATDELL